MARGAPRRRYRNPFAGLEPRPRRRLLARIYGAPGARNRNGSRSIHRLARAGPVLLSRRGCNSEGPRQGGKSPRRALQSACLPRYGARARLRAAAGALGTRRSLHRGGRQGTVPGVRVRDNEHRYAHEFDARDHRGAVRLTQTGRTDEVDRLCAAMAARWPEAVSAFEFGLSAEGRPMRALIASRSGALSAQDLHARGTPILMVQAGIHPGESDGKDAGFIALRELLSGAAASGVIEHIALLFVPAFNTDGHERLGRWNRPNQNGPEITGSRATAENLNLNRDYTKADAPEMQALLALISEWDPLICADLHVTDGADFEPDVSIQVEPVNQGDPQLHPSGIKMRDELIAKLARQGSLPLPFYPDLFEI